MSYEQTAAALGRSAKGSVAKGPVAKGSVAKGPVARGSAPSAAANTPAATDAPAAAGFSNTAMPAKDARPPKAGSAIGQLLDFAGRRKAFALAGCVLSAVHAVCAMVPLVLVWFVARDLLAVRRIGARLRALPFTAGGLSASPCWLWSCTSRRSCARTSRRFARRPTCAGAVSSIWRACLWVTSTTTRRARSGA